MHGRTYFHISTNDKLLTCKTKNTTKVPKSNWKSTVSEVKSIPLRRKHYYSIYFPGISAEKREGFKLDL
jgi:hypothetical protein